MSLIQTLGHGRLARPAPARALRAVLAEWAARTRQRRALARLDDRMLDDVGLTRAMAAREAARLPWQAPIARPGRR